MLPRCLAAVREAVDEIVVVDTGSADRTVEIARSFGAKVIDFEWTGSFSDARNVSFDAATGDWVMYLDADEVLVAEDAARLRALTGKVWREAFYLVETNFTGELEDGTAVTHNALRVFRNRPEYRFEGRLHEQIGHTLPGAARVEMTDVRIEHYGYLGVVRDAKEKSRRNIELLKRQHEEDGVEDSNRVFFHFNLGSEYGAAGEPVPARDEFAKAWEILQASGNHRALGFVPSLIQRYVAALRITGDHAGAHARAEEGLELFPGFTDLVLEQASAARDCGDTARAIELYERCLEWGDAPSRYTATVGAGTYIALVALADVRRVRGELAEAERLLGRCLDEHPGYLGVVGPLAGVMLARGADADTVVDAIESRVREATPNVRFQLGIALYEAAQTVHAEAQFRGVLARQPDNRPARVALAEALLSQSRFEEAAAEAQLLRGDESPYATPALRAELFARLVVGDGEAAGEALAAAPAALHPAEHALFSAWHALAGGDPVPQSLPLEAVPLLATTLEALLRVQQFDAFGLLVGLLDRTGLPWRERRELLASTYLRRGYLESAADEWITVCQERGPDAPALIGLAQVAVARDLPADALLFAREATSMDPAHPGAARLLANLQAA
jgi:tetratricopeptide (TPR) repeat protein